MKVVKLAAVALGSALALSACGGGSSQGSSESGNNTEGNASATAEETDSSAPESDATLTVWSDPEREAAIKEQAERFKQDTGVTVTVVQKNFEDLRNDFVQQVPTGEGPDITVGAHDWLGALVMAGVVDTVDIGETASEFESVALDAFTYDGQLYALPYSIEALALIQNVDMVGEEAPKTFDEMVQKAKDAGAERPLAITTNGETGDGYYMYALQTSFGAPVFNQSEDGSYKSEVGMGGEKGLAFAQWLHENGKSGTNIISTTVDYDINNELFSSGKAPYTIQGPWAIPVYEKAGIKVKVNPIPTAGGETAAPFVGVQGFYLSAQSKNKLMATDFLLNYLGSEEGQQALFDADPRIPARSAVAEAAASDPILAGFLASSQVGVPMPNIPEMGAVWDFWNAAESQIINGADPVKTWNTMVSNIEAEINK